MVINIGPRIVQFISKNRYVYEKITVRPSKLTSRSFDFTALVTSLLPISFSTLYSSGVEVFCNAMLASFKASIMAHIASNAVAISIFSELSLRPFTSGFLKTSLRD